MNEETASHWFGPHSGKRPAARGMQIGATVLVQLASVVVLSRLLDPEIFGLMAAVQFFLILLGQFNATAFANSIVHQEEVTPEQASVLFWTNCVTGLFLFSIMGVIGYPLAVLLDQPVLLPVAIVLGCFFILNPVSAVHMALMERHAAHRRLMLIQSVGGLFGLIVAVLMAILGLGIWALVGQALSAALIWILLSWRLVDWIPGRPHRHTGLKMMLRNGLSASPANLVNCLTHNIQPLLLAKFAGPLEAGYFNRAQVAFQRPLSQLQQPLMTALSSGTSIESDADKEVESSIHKACYVQAFVLLPVIVLFICFSDVVVPLLLGRNFLAAGPVVMWLAIGFAPAVLSGDLLFAKQLPNDGWAARLPLIGLPILLIAMLWAAPHGAIDVAIVAAAYQWILTFPKAWLQLKQQGYDMSRYLASVEIRGIQVVALIAIAFLARQWLSNWYASVNVGVMVGFLVIGYLVVAASFAAFKDGREILKAAKERGSF